MKRTFSLGLDSYNLVSSKLPFGNFNSRVFSSMSVGWLIDAEMFPEYQEDLVRAIESQGYTVRRISAPSPPYRWDDAGCSYREAFPKGHCVVAHGDIELVTRIHQERRWNPGAFCTIEHFYCSSYVLQFGEFWLNRDYVMLPFGDLKRQGKLLFEKFGVNGQIFVRPDSPLKLFTGQTANVESFDADLEFMGFYDFPQNAMVVVSSPKKVLKEWRFVVARQQVVAGCMYSTNGQFKVSQEYDSDAFKFASRIAALGFEPDPAWIVDICETDDGELHMLEIGGFSFAELYACDKSAVVEVVSEVALSIWSKEHER